MACTRCLPARELARSQALQRVAIALPVACQRVPPFKSAAACRPSHCASTTAVVARPGAVPRRMPDRDDGVPCVAKQRGHSGPRRSTAAERGHERRRASRRPGPATVRRSASTRTDFRWLRSARDDGARRQRVDDAAAAGRASGFGRLGRLRRAHLHPHLLGQLGLEFGELERGLRRDKPCRHPEGE